MRNVVTEQVRRLLRLAGTGLLLASATAYSDPQVLHDVTLQDLTAGQAQSAAGVIVGNSSESLIDARTSVVLGAESQSNSRGLNLINTADSAAANTLNIWDGDVISFSIIDDSINTALEINQANQIFQQQFQSATLSGYVRSGTDTTEIFRHSEEQAFLSDLVNVKQVTDRNQEVTTTTSENHSMVDTSFSIGLGDLLYLDGHLGQGVASSGDVSAVYDGGEVEIAMAINGGFSASADLSATNSVLLTEASLGVSTSLDLGMSLLTTIELPRMELELQGAGCGVILGSCSASGTSTDSTFKVHDHSTLDIFENHQSGTASLSEEIISITRSPFTLDSASATYVVIDDSSLLLELEESLQLSESVQKDIEVMNLVNAVSSDVANAINISRASQFENVRSRLILNQFNTVRHGQ